MSHSVCYHLLLLILYFTLLFSLFISVVGSFGCDTCCIFDHRVVLLLQKTKSYKKVFCRCLSVGNKYSHVLLKWKLRYASRPGPHTFNVHGSASWTTSIQWNRARREKVWGSSSKYDEMQKPTVWIRESNNWPAHVIVSSNLNWT